MTKLKLRTTFVAAAMLAGTLFSGFQAKSQTNITDVGSISLTSITNPAFQQNGTQTAAVNGGFSITPLSDFNFAGTINNMSALTAGEQITIPITVAGASGTAVDAHFPTLNLAFNDTVNYNGQTIFNVSYSNNTITLTATAAAATAAGNGSLSFFLEGQTSLNTIGNTTEQYNATSTVYTVGGNTFTLTNNPVNPSANANYYALLTSSNSVATGSAGATMQTSFMMEGLPPLPLNSPYDTAMVYGIGYSIGSIYDSLLNGTYNSAFATSKIYSQYLTQDVISIVTFSPYAPIASVSWYPQSGVNYVSGGNMQTTNLLSTVPAFTDVSSADSLTLVDALLNSTLPTSGTTLTSDVVLAASAQLQAAYAKIEAVVQPGQRAIVQNSDGSYTIAVNFGPLLNNSLLEYPAGTDVSGISADDQNAVDSAMKYSLAAVLAEQYFQITYTNAPTFVSNMPNTPYVTNTNPLLGGDNNTPEGIEDNDYVFHSGAMAMPNLYYVNNSTAGQSAIKVNYVDASGNPIPGIPDTTNYGWASNNNNNNGANPTTAAGIIRLNASLPKGGTLTTTTPPDTITVNGTTYVLVTEPDSIATAATALGTTADSILTGATTVPYPTMGNIANVYFVYEAVPTPLPITGLQLTAQPQGNTVNLSWGTLTEINSKSFTVQRSADEGKTWVTVTTQPTKAMNGNSSVPLSYTAQDIVLQNGSYEYRVVETDVDGSTTVSNVATVNITTNGSAVYPNPTKGLLNVVLPAGVSSATYRMISSDGKIVLSGTMTNAGNHGTIEVAGIASGIYFLLVTVNNATQTYKVQIQQ